MAVYADLSIDQGSTFIFYFEVTNPDGSVYDLTDYSVRAQLRRAYASSAFIEFTSEISDAVNGIVVISLSPDQTSDLKPGRYLYDVELSLDSNTIVNRVLEGQIEVTPRVTRPQE
jgi:hypothetical protein